MAATCPICNKEFKNEAGMTGHLRFSHPGAGMVSESALKQLQSDVAALAQVVTKALGGSAGSAVEATNEVTEEVTKKRNKSMEDSEVMTVKDYKIEKLSEELARVRLENESLKAKPAAPADIPDLGAIIEHCESGECKDHAAQWHDIKKQIVTAAYDNMPPKLVERKAEEMGFAPKRIVISRREQPAAKKQGEGLWDPGHLFGK